MKKYISFLVIIFSLSTIYSCNKKEEPKFEPINNTKQIIYLDKYYENGFTFSDENTYVINQDTKIINKKGWNAITIEGSSRVTLILCNNAKLEVYGSDSTDSKNPGGAGIFLPETTTLEIKGKGTINAKGGNGSKGEDGKDASSCKVDFETENSAYAGNGGDGGNGGAGAGAAIGTYGGFGGEKGEGGNYPGSHYLLDEQPARIMDPGYDFDKNGNIGSNGKVGGNSLSMGKLIVNDQITINAIPGEMSKEIPVNGKESKNDDDAGSGYEYNYCVGGAGGGGAGTNGLAPKQGIGSGGPGGPGGGGGGSGGSHYSMSSHFYCGGGTGGSGINEGNPGYYTHEKDGSNRIYGEELKGGNGGSGGLKFGSRGSNGTILAGPDAIINGADQREINRSQIKINFDLDNGAYGSTYQYASLDLPTMIDDIPYKEGYTFSGYFDNRGIRYFDREGYPIINKFKDINTDLYLTAKYDINDSKKEVIELTSEIECDEKGSLYSIYDGKSLRNKINTPVKYGYTFQGYFDENNDQYYDFEGYLIKDGKPNKLIAKYMYNTFNVHYDSNNGEGKMDDSTIRISQNDKLSKNQFNKPGYHFKGWSLTKDGEINFKDEEIIDTTKNLYKNPLTLYAVWEANNIKVTIKDISGNFDVYLAYNKLPNQLDKNKITINKDQQKLLGYFYKDENGNYIKYFYPNGNPCRIWDLKDKDNYILEPIYKDKIVKNVLHLLEGKNWMDYIDDDTYISQLNIPATHDSSTKIVLPKAGDDLAICQKLNINEQLDVGVRAFDLRYRYFHDTFMMCHGDVITYNCIDDLITEGDASLTLENILKRFTKFLEDNPSETIFFYLAKEVGDDAPDGVLNALLDKYNVIDFRGLEEERTTLKEVRGKIIRHDPSSSGIYNDYDARRETKVNQINKCFDIAPLASLNIPQSIKIQTTICLKASGIHNPHDEEYGGPDVNSQYIKEHVFFEDPFEKRELAKIYNYVSLDFADYSLTSMIINSNYWCNRLYD